MGSHQKLGERVLDAYRLALELDCLDVAEQLLCALERLEMSSPPPSGFSNHLTEAYSCIARRK